MSLTDVPLPPTAAATDTTTSTMKPEDAVPYVWSECQPPPETVLKMWAEVGNKLDKESTGELSSLSSRVQ